MTDELKTLKDLDFDNCTNWDDDSRGYDIDEIKIELKQEAIKWIKVWKQELKGNSIYENVVTIRTNCFKMFFNITEEDLE